MAVSKFKVQVPLQHFLFGISLKTLLEEQEGEMEPRAVIPFPL
jgi:hypothetical protein